MKKKIPFVKYTSYGNNFVIVNEIEMPLFSENEKSRFAHFATNMSFGVGSDNFLVIQRCTEYVLEEITKDRGYWTETPEINNADFVFRMFEPDGTEAFSCGNGLMCIASYLFRTYKIESARIVTEIPGSTPKIVNIGTESMNRTSWANLGHPRKIPYSMFKPPISKSFDDEIHSLSDLEISFRAHDLKPFSDKTVINLKAYLVFTGEPHLVVFPGQDGLLDAFKEVLFASSSHNNPSGKSFERRANFGIWLVDQIGLSINRNYLTLFPAGMNVNFARRIELNDADALEYRCFERGINRETLACGTGAIAVSHISKRLNLIQSQNTTALPYRCRLHDSNARIHVKEDESGYRIHGYPVMLFEGEVASGEI
ncbi:MAG: hypothetical protein JEZ12_23160 [Desulfobacterium sp.]|nr:hypothetical protein [Desulfobacterium sp.]